MRLSISVDNIRHEIDSIDPELLGRWIVEIFTRTGPWNPATYIQFRAWPSWIYDQKSGQQGRPLTQFRAPSR